MIEGPSAVRQIDVKRAEHLQKGVSPILACVGTPEDFKYDGKINWILSGKPITYAHDVDFYGKPKELKEKGFETDSAESYVISPTDKIDKYSKNLVDCTGLIIAGIEKGTDKNISFMSQQNPSYFVGDFLQANGRKLSEDLTKKIKEIKNRCKDGTIDAVIFGGRYAKVREFEKSDPKKDMFIEEYKKSIEFLSKIIKKEIGFDPSIIAGPKTLPGSDYVFYDTEYRRLYFIREKRDFDAVQSFTPSELKEREKNWQPGEWGLPI